MAASLQRSTRHARQRMNARFITRTACPVCTGHEIQTLFSRPYAEPQLRHALELFYARVGKLDYESLEGAEYVVQRCGECGLVFQRDVPNDFLLGLLYEEWISPSLAYTRYHSQVAPL